MHALVICKIEDDPIQIQSKMKALQCPRHCLHYKSMGKKKMANSSEVNCNLTGNRTYPRCYASRLLTIRPKLKTLSCSQYFYRRSRASSSKIPGRIWPEFELIRDFMPILFTCKRDADPVKHEAAIVSTTFSQLYVYGNRFVAH